jgi:hypothetical protein
MPRGTFVVFRADRFPETSSRRTYKTEEKRPRASRDDRSDPVFTSIRLSNESSVSGYEQALVTHRKGVKIEGLWHGNIISEVVQQKKFDAYYNRERQIFIAQAEKEIALAAAEALSSDNALREFFRFRSIELDFSQITPRAINVIGAWFKGMRYTNIRTEAAFGSHITVDAEFSRMAQHGNQSNLLVVIDHGGEHLKVNISKVGSAFFMEEYPLETCLGFVENLLRYERIQNPSSP